MDVVLKKGSLTYRVIGGVFDFYFFAGPKPGDVVRQYQEVIGKPAMVPYWSLGFHQCRYGYQNIWEVDQVVDGYAREKIPLEAMWTDIEYMDGYRDFTFDPSRYPLHEVRKFKKKLQSQDQKYVLIVDPGIKIDKGLRSYDQGLEMDIFMKNPDGSNMVGSVWPGLVHFPDFFHPRSQQYWDESFKTFFDMIDLDGIWIDMNELANFCDGDCRKKPEPAKTAIDVNYPPYRINNGGYQMPLFFRTTAMDAVHYGGIKEYDVHNLYGLMEAKATYNTMLKLHPDQRPFILSRSTFPGSGQYTAHWTGDNWSTWPHMHYAIIGILNFQLYGIPFVGADICGFGGDTTEQLCARWTAIGAFYPFSRNHNEIKGIPQ